MPVQPAPKPPPTAPPVLSATTSVGVPATPPVLHSMVLLLLLLCACCATPSALTVKKRRPIARHAPPVGRTKRSSMALTVWRLALLATLPTPPTIYVKPASQTVPHVGHRLTAGRVIRGTTGLTLLATIHVPVGPLQIVVTAQSAMPNVHFATQHQPTVQLAPSMARIRPTSTVQAVWLPVPTTHSPPRTPTFVTLVTQNVQFALVQLQPSVHSATRPTCSATLLVMPPVLRVMVRPTRPFVCSVMPSALPVSSLLTIARPVQRVVLTRRSWTQIWLILSVRRPVLTLHSSPTLRLTSVTPVTLVVHPVALPVAIASVVKLALDG